MFRQLVTDMEATEIVSYVATDGDSYRRLASATPSSHEEDPRNVRYPSKCYRVGPLPVVGSPMTGLRSMRLPLPLLVSTFTLPMQVSDRVKGPRISILIVRYHKPQAHRQNPRQTQRHHQAVPFS